MELNNNLKSETIDEIIVGENKGREINNNTEIKEKEIEEIKIGKRRKKNKRWIILLILLVLLIAVLLFLFRLKVDNLLNKTDSAKTERIVTQNETVSKDNIQNVEADSGNKEFDISKIEGVESGEIVFENEGLLWVYDTEQGEIEQIYIEDLKKQARNDKEAVLPERFFFSKEGKYLFFSLRKDDKDFIYIYDFEDKKLVNSFESCINANVGWIANDYSYLVVDCGTAPGIRERTIYDFMTAKKLTEFGGVGLFLVDEGILAEKEGKNLWVLPFGPTPATTSIYFIEDKEFNEKLLFEGDYQTSYSVVENLGNGKFIYEKEIFSESFPSEGSISYEELNKADFQEKWIRIYENTSSEYYEYDMRDGKSKKLNNYEFEKTNEICGFGESCSSEKRWKVSIDRNWPDSIVFVSSADNSYRKDISYGNSAIWRP